MKTTTSKDKKPAADKKVKATETKRTAPVQEKASPVAQKTAVETPVAEKKAAAKPANFPLAITYEEISRRAYQLWLERGGAHGFDVEDWLTAEKELVKTGR